MKADLHVHSFFSDGKKSVEEIILYAKEKGIECISITDHDTLAAYYDPHINDMFIIKGIELSTYSQETVHLLGYFPPNANTYELEEYLKNRKIARLDRAIHICGLLKRYFNIELDSKELTNKGIIARPHIAQAIIDKGYPYTMEEIFAKMIGEGCPCYIPSSNMSLRAGIELLKRNGAFVVLAHPILLKKTEIDELISLGIGGLEGKYPLNPIGYERELRDKYEDMVITAGSDYHADERHSDLGECTLTGYELKNFLKKVGYHME